MATSKYETHVKPRFEEIKEWASQGLTDKQIYTNLNIGKNAFYQYLNFHQDFKDILTHARNSAVLEVENSLFKMCVGYPYWEETAQKVKRKKYNEEGKVVEEYEELEKVSVQKYSTANITAISFYLVNRAKAGWASNPHNNELKKEELKIKKELKDLDEW